ncbi:925_t:CDS:1 [Dentiscutata heterogama]|uniref:925_t:CDS:1 n=1 Tax=Dentiscutata heterogama TaxID=1316150 RepID=A0ACA9L4Z3_9GLOM|nr:925_t:CDS:1 [Dentiscutata heterogama]
MYEEIIGIVYPKYIEIPTNILNPENMFRSLFIHEPKGLNRPEELTFLKEIQTDIKKSTKRQYTIITIFRERELVTQPIQTLAAKWSKNAKIYPEQYTGFGGHLEEYDKTYWNCIIRETQEEIGFQLKPERLQFIRTHDYLSKNRSGTDPITNTDKNESFEPIYYIEIAMYLYLALPHEWDNIKHKEPENMSKPQWMTRNQMNHQIWTPSIQYYKDQIFDEYIPQYLEEWTNYGKITNNLFQQQFPDKEIPNEYKTPYDGDKQEIMAEKPNHL